jgi:hypothetical protein
MRRIEQLRRSIQVELAPRVFAQLALPVGMAFADSNPCHEKEKHEYGLRHAKEEGEHC